MARPDDTPQPFGKFLIERELGRGGHGIVFLSVDGHRLTALRADPTRIRRIRIEPVAPEVPLAPEGAREQAGKDERAE